MMLLTDGKCHSILFGLAEILVILFHEIFTYIPFIVSLLYIYISRQQ